MVIKFALVQDKDEIVEAVARYARLLKYPIPLDPEPFNEYVRWAYGVLISGVGIKDNESDLQNHESEIVELRKQVESRMHMFVEDSFA